MFLEKIDWNDPRFKRWNLSNLAPLNKAQQDAFFEDDEVDFPDFSETELKAIALKFPCRVELFHSNVCYGIEKNWPERLFGKPKYMDLLPHQKRTLIQAMLRDGVKLYKKYVDKDRLKRRLQQKTNLALAEYYQERLLRNRFIRIRALGNYVGCTDSDSDGSVMTVIDKSKPPSTGAPINNEADSNSRDVRVTKRSQRRVQWQDLERPVDVHRVLTRSRLKAAYQLKPCTRAPPSNQLASTCQTRKLRSNFPQHGPDEGDGLFLTHKDFPTGDDGVAMHVEVANQNSQQNGDVLCQIKIVEHIDITDECANDSDDNDGTLIIDESFDDATLSQNSLTSFNGNASLADILSSRLESSELVCTTESVDIRYMHANFNESVELYLSQMNAQIE